MPEAKNLGIVFEDSKNEYLRQSLAFGPCGHRRATTDRVKHAVFVFQK